MSPRQPTSSKLGGANLRSRDEHLKALATEFEALDNAIDQVRNRARNLRYYLMRVLYGDR